jgi:hypothetical protein
MKTIREIAKRDSKLQLALVEVYVPDELDSQGEFASAETLEKAAHEFAARGNHNNISIMHNGERIDASVVESYIAKKGDPMFKAGTWVAVLKVRDSVVWDAIEKGLLTGVSFEGRGYRREAMLNGRKAQEMYDLDIHTISLVDKPANRRPFAMTKRDATAEALSATLNKLAETISETNGAISKIQERMSEHEQRIDAMVTGRPVAKVDTTRNAGQIEYQLRKRERLQDRLESIMDRPDLFEDGAEAAISKSLRDIDDELYALGYHAQDAATMDSGSGFAFRGGRSDFLQASVSSFDDVLGLSHTSRNISKSDEDEIDLNCLII